MNRFLYLFASILVRCLLEISGVRSDPWYDRPAGQIARNIQQEIKIPFSYVLYIFFEIVYRVFKNLYSRSARNLLAEIFFSLSISTYLLYIFIRNCIKCLYGNFYIIIFFYILYVTLKNKSVDAHFSHIYIGKRQNKVFIKVIYIPFDFKSLF